jgi:hypothetical protein
MSLVHPFLRAISIPALQCNILQLKFHYRFVYYKIMYINIFNNAKHAILRIIVFSDSNMGHHQTITQEHEYVQKLYVP